MKVLVINGPNLNLLGGREPATYGSETLSELEEAIGRRAHELGCEVEFFQSNSEAEIVGRVQRASGEVDGIVINPGALSHYSYSLYDCLRSAAPPVVEVHLSNVHARREEFRRRLVTAPAAVGIVSGLGARGYLFAMEFLCGHH